MPPVPFLCLMTNEKRLPVPLTDSEHMEIKIKAAVLGLPMAEVARRLLRGWLRGDVDLPIYSGDVFDGGRITERTEH